LIPEILVAVNTKNFEKLVDLILNGKKIHHKKMTPYTCTLYNVIVKLLSQGDGKQLQDIETSNKDIQVFIRNIPGFQTKIQKTHNSVKDGSLEKLKVNKLFNMSR